MKIIHPNFLLLLVPIALMIWLWPKARLLRPLRLLTLLSLLLALADIQWMHRQSEAEVFVLMDRSDSVRAMMDERQRELETLLKKQEAPHRVIRLIDFAQDTSLREDAATGAAPGATDESRLAQAIAFALQQRALNKQTRILAITDGYSTDDLSGVEAELLSSGVPLDFRMLGQDQKGDYQVGLLQVPSRVRLQERFIVDARVDGDRDGEVPYLLRRNHEVIGRGKIHVEKGQGWLRFVDQARTAGAAQYELEIVPPNDPVPGNNSASQWLVAEGQPVVLLLTAYENDPVGKSLRADGLEVRELTDFGALQPADLSGADAVIINNVPAGSLHPDFQEGIRYLVEVRGGGLLMLGGRNSYGAGGYGNTPLEDLLPVTTQLRVEHRKLALSMAIVLDRSGSMGVGVQGGKTKMELANSGAIAAASFLGQNDTIAVIAVDSEPHLVVPITTAGKNFDVIAERVRGINSAGGGIYVYTGLRAAWEQLQTVSVGQRHIILFADAADAEEPGNYQQLLETVRKAGVTVSVLALGTEKDVDAAFLRDVARRGNGRIYFSDNAFDLPMLFSQETVAVARSSYIEAHTPTIATAAWVQLSSQPVDWLDTVSAYSLGYAKPGAIQVLKTDDDFNAPLVAFWPKGAGKSAAVTFPVSGLDASATRAWTDYDQFLQTLVRWLLPRQLPPGVDLHSRVEGDQLVVTFRYGSDWEKRVLRNPPKLMVPTEGEAAGGRIPWQRIQPGLMESRVPLTPGTPQLGVVQWDEGSGTIGPALLNARQEWIRDDRKQKAVKSLSAISGGEERVNLADVFKPTASEHWSSLRLGLITLALIAFLFDLADTRAGLFQIIRNRWRRK